VSATLVKGLAGFKQFKAQKDAEREARERPRANYFNWKNNKNKEDKDIVYIRFLQEFDTEIPGFSEDRGLPVMAVEHQAPGAKGFMRRANCTQESEGQCYACERHREDRSLGWQQRSNFYIWVLVDYNDGEGAQPVVIARSFGSSFVEDLIVEVEEDAENKITDKMWKVTRSGSGKKTSWKIRKAPANIELLDDAGVELIPLEEAVLRPIPYDEQAEYYGAVYKDGDPIERDDEARPAAPAGATAGTKAASGELEW
jgi:hypothetical protein